MLSLLTTVLQVKTTGCSPFETVYAMNPISPLDITPIHITDHFSGEANERAKVIKKIHEQVRQDFEANQKV